jgi:hypothetical protein
VVIRQAEILTFRFLGCAQPVALRFETGIGLGELTQWENDASKNLLREVVKEVALILRLSRPRSS